MILEYIKLHKEHTGVTLSLKDIPDSPAGMYKKCKKRKMVASEEKKEVKKPPKKKFVASKLVQKEVKEVAASTNFLLFFDKQ